MKLLLTILLAVFSLTGCQVKETKSSGGLIADHTPTENAFTVVAPSVGFYAAGDVLRFALKFPYAVTVDTTGGTPQLAMKIGSSTVTVPLSSGAGTKTLTFNYTVLPGQTDNNGIELLSLSLNGGRLTFDLNGETKDCDVTSITTELFSGVKIDNTSPVITGLSLQTIPGFYTVGKFLEFKMAFSENVYVTGSPRFSLTFTTNTGATAYANYQSGSGSKNIIFRYVITNATADTNGYDSIVSPLELNSGTIKDVAGNSLSSLAFSTYTAAVISASVNVKFDGRVPFVTSITPPAGGKYSPSDNIDFRVNFNRAVNVTGSPTIGLTFASGTRLATYVSGSTTTSLLFRYTVVPGDSDPNGIAIAPSIVANGGTIVGAAAPANTFFTPTQNNLFTVPNTTNVIVDAAQPQITSVTRTADSAVSGSSSTDNIWIIGQQLQLSLTFNRTVSVNQTGGIPRVPITIGSTTRYASYVSGSGSTSLFFQYIIQTGDLDTDTTIALSDLDLNGGTISDINGTTTILTMPIASLTATSVDGIRPSISTVTAPPDKTYSNVAGNNHLTFPFTVTWSEAVNYSSTASASTFIPLTIGVNTVNAVYVSGNNTATIIYRPASLASQNDLDGISMPSTLSGTAVIKDLAGNTASAVTFTAPSTASIFVDTTAPTLTGLSAPADKTYLNAEQMNFTATFSEPVTVNVVTGYPRITMTVGGTNRFLVPTASGTASTHTFRYTVAGTDLDSDGVVLGSTVAMSTGGAFIRDAGLNNLTGSFTAPITTGIFVEGVLPTISSVVRPVDGTYEGGNVLSFTVNYSEAVDVSGSPSINLTAQTGTLPFVYSGGSGTTSLSFSYTVTDDDLDLNGLGTVAAFSMNGGTIQDLAGNNAPGTFTSQNLNALFITPPNTVVWTTNNFINRAPGSGITLSSGGVSTTAVCGLTNCRVFNGDDSLSISGAISNVEHIFIAFRLNNVYGSYDLISPDIAILNDGTRFDLDTADADINANGVSYSGTTHNTNYTVNTLVRLEASFTTPANFSAGVLIPTSFLGRVGDIIIVDGPLTPGQKTAIRNYLNTKF